MNRVIVNTHPELPLEFNLWIQTRLSMRMEWLEINPKVAGSSPARGAGFCAKREPAEGFEPPTY